MSNYIITNGELYHFGVKGMKWGHRKKYYTDKGNLNKLGKARAAYKEANKAFNKSYNDAYKFSERHFISQHFGKNKATSNQKWGDVYDKANALKKAKSEYKGIKKEHDKKIREKRLRTLGKGIRAVGKIFGDSYDVLMYESAVERTANYGVDAVVSMLKGDVVGAAFNTAKARRSVHEQKYYREKIKKKQRKNKEKKQRKTNKS